MDFKSKAKEVLGPACVDLFRRIWGEAAYQRMEGWHRASARWSRRSGVTKKGRNPELVVSLTSIPERMGTLHLCLDGLLRQSIKPDRIVLWLGSRSGQDGVALRQGGLPKALYRLRKRGLDVRFCKDIGPYTKIIPALLTFPQALIVTADDDMFYPEHWLRDLFEAYRDEPQYIHCHRAHLMKFDVAGKILPYREWTFFAPGLQGPSLDLFPTGVGGVLYAPGHLHAEVLNENAFLALSPRSDDVWLKAMSLLNGVPCKKVRQDTPWFEPVRIPGNRELWTSNQRPEGNDPRIEAVRQVYGVFTHGASGHPCTS